MGHAYMGAVTKYCPFFWMGLWRLFAGRDASLKSFEASTSNPVVQVQDFEITAFFIVISR